MHYAFYGWKEGRDPSAYFDVNYYLQNNPDVAAAGVDPLIHYRLSGWREGRDPSDRLSTSAYLTVNPDVAAAGIDPLLHFTVYGQYEGRQAYSPVLVAASPLPFDPGTFVQQQNTAVAGPPDSKNDPILVTDSNGTAIIAASGRPLVRPTLGHDLQYFAQQGEVDRVALLMASINDFGSEYPVYGPAIALDIVKHALQFKYGIWDQQRLETGLDGRSVFDARYIDYATVAIGVWGAAEVYLFRFCCSPRPPSQ